MDKDRIEGKVEKAKGYVKEKAGQILNDPDLKAEGKADRLKGEIKETVGKAKDKVRELVEEVAK